MKGKAMKPKKKVHGYCVGCKQWQQVTPNPTLKTRLLSPQGVCDWCDRAD